MTEEIFNQKKSGLEAFLLNELDRFSLLDKQRTDIQDVLKILKDYNFGNRHRMKGLLARTVVDSFDLNNDIGIKIIQFDNTL